MAAPPSISVSAPYTLFPLAPPPTIKPRTGLSREHGRSCFTSLVDLPSSKKRKLISSQVSAAVDGEGVNIYDVSSTQIISSFATPPSTKFSCAPASIRTANLCRTYAAVSHPKKQILCWAETKSSESSTAELEHDSYSNFSWANDTGADVVLLKDLYKGKRKESSPTSGNVLVVFSNSDIKCFSADLSSERWSITPTRRAGPIVYAAITTVTIAKKAIFKNRPDVILRDAIDDPDTENLVLLTISQKAKRKAFIINFHFIPTSLQAPPINKARYLLTVSIPSQSELVNSIPPAFTVNFPTGTLHCLLNGRLVTYSLNTSTASLLSTIPLKSSRTGDETPQSTYSLICISSTLVLVSTPDDLSLYETKYSSLQARTPFQNEPSMKNLHLDLYIKGMDLVIGYSHDGIAAVQLSRPDSLSKHKNGTGLLLNSICRGVEDLSVTEQHEDLSKTIKNPILNALTQAIINEELAEQKTLSRLKESRGEDIDQFETHFAYHVGVKIAYPEQQVEEHEGASNGNESFKMMNGISASEEENNHNSRVSKGREREFITPKSKAWENVKRQGYLSLSEQLEQERNFYWRPLSEKFVISVLNMIFELKPDGSRLEISFFPTNVVKYLVESGNFSPTLLRMAEKQQRDDMIRDGRLQARELTAPMYREIGNGGFVDCLIEYDSSLHHLAWFFREAGEIEINEVIAAIKIVLSRFSDTHQPLLISSSMDDEDEELRLQRLTQEAEAALERAASALDQIPILEEVLRLSLQRMKSFPSEVVVRGLRSGLGGDELMALIRILRKELVMDRQGDGAEDLYDEDGLWESSASVDAADIELICELLTCALDAVGIAGLILANDTVVGRRTGGFNVDFHGELEMDIDSDDEGKDANQLLISSLHSEVTHAVRNVEEAAALSGLLAELFRHAGGIEAIKAQQEEEKERRTRQIAHTKLLEKQDMENQRKDEQKQKEITGNPPAKGKSTETDPSTQPPPSQSSIKGLAAESQSSITTTPVPSSALRSKPSTIYSHHKYLLSNRHRGRRQTSIGADLSTLAARKMYQKKLIEAHLPIPTFLKQLSLRGRNKRTKGSGKKNEVAKPVGLRDKKDAMLPLGLPPKAIAGPKGERWILHGTTGEVRKENPYQLEMGIRRSVGVYSLEKLVV